MVETMTKVRVMPTGMRLNEYVALEEGFFAAEGLEVEIMWDVLRGQMARWSDTYKERPQDVPFQSGVQCIGSACAWGSISNAGAGMGKFVPDVHGVSPWGIYVRPDSKIKEPADLKDVPIAVGLRAGSHFNVPYHLEKHLPLENIKAVNVGGFGVRLRALIDKEFEAVSLLPPQLDMAEQLGMRKVIGGEFKTLWWVDERWEPATLRSYFRALQRAEEAIAAAPKKYLPLWKHSNPPELAEYPWDYTRFGRGERFVHAPISKSEFDEWMAHVKRWKLDDHLVEKRYEELTRAVA